MVEPGCCWRQQSASQGGRTHRATAEAACLVASAGPTPSSTKQAYPGWGAVPMPHMQPPAAEHVPTGMHMRPTARPHLRPSSFSLLLQAAPISATSSRLHTSSCLPRGLPGCRMDALSAAATGPGGGRSADAPARTLLALGRGGSAGRAACIGSDAARLQPDCSRVCPRAFIAGRCRGGCRAAGSLAGRHTGRLITGSAALCFQAAGNAPPRSGQHVRRTGCESSPGMP